VLFSWRAWLHSWLPGEVSSFQEENEAEVFILLCLDTGQPGSDFKILHTRQSEIILELPRKNPSNPS